MTLHQKRRNGEAERERKEHLKILETSLNKMDSLILVSKVTPGLGVTTGLKKVKLSKGLIELW